MTYIPIKRALISVSDKQGIVPFAKQLHELGIELISTGGTSALLRSEHIPVLDVADVTGFPEIMDGRIKTLHPKIHGGILGKRTDHAEVAKTHDIPWIDLVIVTLYPFAQVSQNPANTFEEIIEQIDIGGPTMIRSAAKNMAYVTVLVDPTDYEFLLAEIRINQGLSQAHRHRLAHKAFEYTAHYDTIIHQYLSQMNQTDSLFPPHNQLSLTKEKVLRYGENPHQKAAAYRLNPAEGGILDAVLHQGKELSFNNIVDAHAAFQCIESFETPACVIVKHANPCGVALANQAHQAFSKAYAADSTSAFGGVIALNRTCDEHTAAAIIQYFFELIIAPNFSEKALELFASKKNLRVLTMHQPQKKDPFHYQIFDGLVLVQEQDVTLIQPDQLHVVTKRSPSAEEIANLLFAWNVVKQVKSNAIVIAKEQQTIGIGPGQVSRIDAVELAIRKAGAQTHQAGLASDAFFPFKDSIEQIAKTGITSIIQPGGSIRDKEVIDACNEHNLAMVFTGIRCFKH